MQLRSAAVLLALALAACNYSAPDEVINGQAVAAVQSPNVPSPGFSQYATYTVTPTVQVFDNRSGTARQYEADAAPIIAQIQKNMTAYGYTYVASPNATTPPTPRPDLAIALYAYLGNQAYGGTYCYWYYWGYYPYDCTYYYYGSYNFGTLIMQMGDLKNAPAIPAPGDKLDTVWASAMYGILGSTSYNLSIVQSSIDRAFAQSPYLKH